MGNSNDTPLAPDELYGNSKTQSGVSTPKQSQCTSLTNLVDTSLPVVSSSPGLSKKEIALTDGTAPVVSSPGLPKKITLTDGTVPVVSSSPELSKITSSVPPRPGKATIIYPTPVSKSEKRTQLRSKLESPNIVKHFKTPNPYTTHVSTAPNPYSTHVSTTPNPYSTHVSTTPNPYSTHVSTAPNPYSTHVSTTPNPHSTHVSTAERYNLWLRQPEMIKTDFPKSTTPESSQLYTEGPWSSSAYNGFTTDNKTESVIYMTHAGTGGSQHGNNTAADYGNVTVGKNGTKYITPADNQTQSGNATQYVHVNHAGIQSQSGNETQYVHVNHAGNPGQSVCPTPATKNQDGCFCCAPAAPAGPVACQAQTAKCVLNSKVASEIGQYAEVTKKRFLHTRKDPVCRRVLVPRTCTPPICHSQVQCMAARSCTLLAGEGGCSLARFTNV